MWIWLWLMFVFLLLLMPLSYGWGYRGWGPPYPPGRFRRRQGDSSLSQSIGHTGFDANTGEEAAAWGVLGYFVWLAFVIAIVWLFVGLAI